MNFDIREFLSDIQTWRAVRGRDFEKERIKIHMAMILEANPIEIGDNSHMAEYVKYVDKFK
jgi:hypothetical protein